ncbi:MAG: efflux RND transporter permease subunit [Planctomycetaceae bacterium]
MSLARFSVNNRVLVNMLMLVILLAGGIFAFTLVREFFPESRPNKVRIAAVYPGQQPEEIEKSVTIKIEEAVHDIEGVEKVDSTISEGISLTTLTLFSDVEDINVLVQEVKSEIDSLADLPEDVERVTIQKLEPRLPVISVALFGQGSETELKRAVKALRDDLLLLPGVSDVQLSGIRDDEISIELKPHKLLEYDVTFDEVASAIRAVNIDVSTGQLKGDRLSVSVRMLGEEDRGVDLSDIVIRSDPDGRKIRLSDLATIHDGFIESDLESYFNGEPAAHCVVFKTRSQDAIQISRVVKAYVKGKLGENFDPFGFQQIANDPWYLKPVSTVGSGMTWLMTIVSGRGDPRTIYEQSADSPFEHQFQVALHTDLARFIEGRLDLMTRNGRAGLMLVLLSLMLFLNWRVAIWVATGLIVSFLGTFIVLWAMGETINLLSMFGLIIVLGIIVDDAIIIGENIYRHVEEGLPPKEAAIRGTDEVAWPVCVTIMTTIAAFTPLLFIRGQIGDFMRVLPIVVLAALTVSLMEALVILPAHLAHIKISPKNDQATGWRRWLKSLATAPDRMMRGRLLDWYARLLRVALTWRYITLTLAVSTVVLSFGLIAGGFVEMVFIQKMDSETMICGVEMPVGTVVAQTRKQVKRLNDFALTLPEVKNVQMFVAVQMDLKGGTGAELQSHLGQMVLELRAADEREADGQRSSDELLVELREFSRTLHGVNSVNWEAMNGGPGGRDIFIKVSGPDFDELTEVAQKLQETLDTYTGVYDLDDDHDEGKREVTLRLKESARATGIDEARLGSHVRSALYGRESHRISRNREDIRVMVRYPEAYRANLYHLESMWIPTAMIAGVRNWVPLSEVARLEPGDGFTSVHRSQRQRAVSVFGAVDTSVADSSVVLNRVRKEFDREIAPKYPDVRIEFLGNFEERTKAFGSLWIAFPVVLVLIYMMLAGLFRSYAQPLVVMAAIPFGLVGAILGHWITGNPITILSQIGYVALAGILVNDSLILVDFINRRIRNGEDPFEASVDGARSRLRAILLTTLTTASGLTPLMFETSFQAKFLVPMAVTLTFGLIFATALTLVIVPSLNLVFLDIKKVTGFDNE